MKLPLKKDGAYRGGFRGFRGLVRARAQAAAARHRAAPFGLGFGLGLGVRVSGTACSRGEEETTMLTRTRGGGGQLTAVGKQREGRGGGGTLRAALNAGLAPVPTESLQGRLRLRVWAREVRGAALLGRGLRRSRCGGERRRSAGGTALGRLGLPRGVCNRDACQTQKQMLVLK
jgi:hypothetical protein